MASRRCTAGRMTRTFLSLSVAVGVALAPAFPAPAFAQDAAAADVTFTKDIAPILQRSCQKCHRPDSLFVFHHATMGIVDPDASPEDQDGARLGGWPVHEVGRNADYFIDDVILQRNSGAPTADWLLTNEAPRLEVQGEATRTVAVGEPLTLTAVATDDGVPEWFRLPPRPTHVTTFGARGLWPGSSTGDRNGDDVRAGAVPGVGGPQSRLVGARLGSSAAAPERQVGGPGDVQRARHLRSPLPGARRRPHGSQGHHRRRQRQRGIGPQSGGM